jgi:benzil reductase ((S)-benzoin forming)
MDLYIVTGASRGIGLAIAKYAAGLGEAQLLAISRSGLPEKIAGAQDVKADLGERDGRRRAAEALATKLREREWTNAVLFNNAARVEPVAPLERCDPDELAHNIDLNLLAPLVLMQAFLASSSTAKKRAVVNISSGAGRAPVFGWTGYCSTKAALDMATRVAEVEAEANGTHVRFTSLAPGMVDTAMQGVIREQSDDDFHGVERFKRMKAEGTLQNAQDVARKIVDLERAGRMPAGVVSLADL